MKKEEAKRILSDVNPEHCFWVNEGPILKNLEELYKALSEMNKGSYAYHANNDKNDFSNWVRDIMGDKKLAEDMLKTKSKKATVAMVRQRLQYLKKSAA